VSDFFAPIDLSSPDAFSTLAPLPGSSNPPDAGLPPVNWANIFGNSSSASFYSPDLSAGYSSTPTAAPLQSQTPAGSVNPTFNNLFGGIFQSISQALPAIANTASTNLANRIAGGPLRSIYSSSSPNTAMGGLFGNLGGGNLLLIGGLILVLILVMKE